MPSAYADIQDGVTWYKQHNSELPKRFAEQIKLSVEKIRQTPFGYAIRYREIRIANIAIFPYAIHYFLQENSITIIAVHHASMSPKRWLSRL